MDDVFVQQPPTTGKVIVTTTFGELEIELWTRETPLTCRNFIQKCLEGYYDDCVFHRIIKDFMVQTGDPTGTGKGGESIFGYPFKDEFHSRLKFTHRGLVAMANSGKPNDNGSQFFITLNECNWLDEKHTIFGRITGNTIYNLQALGGVEVDEHDKPTEIVPKITKTGVTVNPYTDIVLSNIVPKGEEAPENSIEEDIKDKRRKEREERSKSRKGNKNKNLISFEDEEDFNVSVGL